MSTYNRQASADAWSKEASVPARTLRKVGILFYTAINRIAPQPVFQQAAYLEKQYEALANSPALVRRRRVRLDEWRARNVKPITSQLEQPKLGSLDGLI
ncbi:hypothetical protein [Azotobacter vinelandii]|uniref:hypothetical protein n=1 Tax=Azotobacter vinelandii TaxID=354 RepID=UPI0007734D71|nr:hypothetical protein [Azotobacter vinelandii]